jgi:ribonuclease BN (tRNA processing enzyme)
MAATHPGLRLDVLGAGPAYTDLPGASGAAYLVRHGSTAVLFDLGQGSFPRLAGQLEPSRLGAVVVSHIHPDHFIDLVALRHYLRWEFEPPRHVRVIAPAGLDGRLDALLAEPGFSAATLGVERLEPGSLRIGDLAVAARRVHHTDDSFAFRVSRAPDDVDAVGLVYSGDCGRADDLVPLIRHGDVLLVEVSFGPGPVPSGAAHLDGPAVGALAAATRPAGVLLTHLLMGFDPDATIAAVRARYDGPVTLVEPGFVMDIG